MKLLRERIKGTSDGTSLILNSRNPNIGTYWHIATITIDSTQRKLHNVLLFTNVHGYRHHIVEGLLNSGRNSLRVLQPIIIDDSEFLTFDFGAIEASDVIEVLISGIILGEGEI